MEADYCLVVYRNRRSPGGSCPDLISFFGGMPELKRVAEASMRLPYVSETRIHTKVRETSTGYPTWGKTALDRKTKSMGCVYDSEKEFEHDLRRELKDDAFFDDIYKTKRDVIESSASGRLRMRSQ